VKIAGREVRTVRRTIQYIRRSPFALRNRMTERTSHLAGLWIGAAISNTSYSNRACSTTFKRARLTGKDQVRQQCCHNKHKKFPFRPTRDVYLLSGHASYLETYSPSFEGSHETNTESVGKMLSFLTLNKLMPMPTTAL